MTCRACGHHGLKVNVGKSKMIIVEKESESMCMVQVDGGTLEVGEDLKDLGIILNESGKSKKEVENRMTLGRKLAGAMEALGGSRG